MIACEFPMTISSVHIVFAVINFVYNVYLCVLVVEIDIHLTKNLHEIVLVMHIKLTF